MLPVPSEQLISSECHVADAETIAKCCRVSVRHIQKRTRNG
jgi:hypothetical protein